MGWMTRGPSFTATWPWHKSRWKNPGNPAAWCFSIKDLVLSSSKLGVYPHALSPMLFSLMVDLQSERFAEPSLGELQPQFKMIFGNYATPNVGPWELWTSSCLQRKRPRLDLQRHLPGIGDSRAYSWLIQANEKTICWRICWRWSQQKNIPIDSPKDGFLSFRKSTTTFSKARNRIRKNHFQLAQMDYLSQCAFSTVRDQKGYTPNSS